MRNIRETHKSSDTEEIIDIYFYRPIGYAEAVLADKLKITPNTITVISIFIGVAAGHLFYYQDIILNIIGILLLVFANSLDSADGQLARMTGQTTEFGRFLDGLAGNIWFVTIYIHLFLRLVEQGYPVYIFFFVLLVGAFHSIQSAMADHYREIHLLFIGKKNREDIDDLGKTKEKYDQLNWKDNFWQKLYHRLYLNYVIEQRSFSKNFMKFFFSLKEKYGENIPDDLRSEFRTYSKPLMKYTNILTHNTRMIALSIAVLLNEVIWFLAFEITVLNIILIYMVNRHEKISKSLYHKHIVQK